MTSILALTLAVGCGGATPPDTAAEPGAEEPSGFTALAPDVYEPCGIARTAAALWVLACTGDAVRVPRDGSARLTRPLAGDILSLDGITGDGAGDVWVLLSAPAGPARRGSVIGLDGSSGEEEAAVELGSSVPTHAVWMEGRLWVAAVDGRLFTVRDSVAREAAAGPPLIWLVTDGRRLWTVAEDGDVTERDAASGAVARTYPGVVPNPIAAAAGMGSVWLASADRGVLRLDLESGRSDRMQIASTVNDLEACGKAMWLSQPDRGLTAVDAAGKTVRDVALPVAPRYLLCDGTTLWILSEDGRLGSIEVTA